jgi:hypothetical protein
LKQIDTDGGFKYLPLIEVEVGIVPNVFSLSDNFPNPFNPTTIIEFTLPSSGKTTLKIFSMLGQEIAIVVDKELSSGTIHRYEFNAAHLPSGIYFYKLEFGNQQLAKKMLLLK